MPLYVVKVIKLHGDFIHKIKEIFEPVNLGGWNEY